MTNRIVACAGLSLIVVLTSTRIAPAVDLNVVTVASGFNMADFVCAPPGDTQRLFVVERRGVIRIIDLATSTIMPTPFLDISTLVVNFSAGNANNGDERGMLGMAFHPNYATNGYFFVYYLDRSASPGDSIIARYTVSGGDPNVADPASGVILKTINQPPANNHKGGCMQFGPDGKLYIGMGDGGGSDDNDSGHNATMGNAQDLSILLGKLLRLDVDIASPYIPSDNPFVGQVGALGEIWSYGLRNPFRWSFDRATGDLYIGDVGQNMVEEIDYMASGTSRGANFGWRCTEGNICGIAPNSGPNCNCPDANTISPVLTYTHASGNGFCIIGGSVYRGSRIPGEYGNYFYGDYSTGRIWTFAIQAGAAVNNTRRFLNLGTNSYPTLVVIGEDGAGELYMVTGAQNLTGQGIVRKIVPACDTPADINADCVKDILDAQILSDALVGVPQSDPALTARSDVNRDGVLDGRDIQAWISGS